MCNRYRHAHILDAKLKFVAPSLRENKRRRRPQIRSKAHYINAQHQYLRMRCLEIVQLLPGVLLVSRLSNYSRSCFTEVTVTSSNCTEDPMFGDSVFLKPPRDLEPVTVRV